jgi:hypothetical protein
MNQLKGHRHCTNYSEFSRSGYYCFEIKFDQIDTNNLDKIVDNRIAFAFPFFNIERLVIVIPTLS